MKKRHYWFQHKMKVVLWSVILLVSFYLLFRFASISFSEGFGQAEGGIKGTIVTNIGIRIMKNGSGLISYSSKEKQIYHFPINLVSDKFVLSQFTRDQKVKKVLAQGISNSLPQEVSDPTQEDQAKEEDSKEDKKNTIGFHNVANGILTKEYILTNGALKKENEGEGELGELPINFLDGHVNAKEEYDQMNENALETFVTNDGTRFTLNQLKDLNFLVRNFYIVDPSTRVTEPLFDAEAFLSKDMTLKQSNEEPQILIYHTHSQEAYIDSRPNKEEDTIVGVGSYLAQILEEEYGYHVIHDKTAYDKVNGVEDRNLAYNYARPALEKMLEKYPSIEVIIDLHRDSGNPRTTIINGKETAQIMLFNGLCRDQNGPLPDHDNPYIQDNLSFSFQLQLKSLELHPGLFKKNYLKYLRYNLHLRPKSILVELGTVENTVESAKNAMEPFAEVLDAVLQGK
ncbi:MAG: stage II sporulation protein P [Clostridiales bacterium]|jgi:stage II sporulation protein P|nr:stage II sporulation protein P [Clostridiales bacterium]